MNNNENQLVISAIGTDRPSIVNELSQLIVTHNANVDDSRMTVLGGEFAIILLVSGKDSILSLVKHSLEQQAEQLGLRIISKETSNKASNIANSNMKIPYVVEVLAIDNPGIVYKLAEFLSSREINIQSLQTNKYPAAHTGTLMFAVEMIIAIPQDVIISDLREDFFYLCDDMNLDASIEVVRV